LIRHESTATGGPILFAFCAERVGYSDVSVSFRINRSLPVIAMIQTNGLAASEGKLRHHDAATRSRKNFPDRGGPNS
jgi:hypothetical protein